MITKKNTIIKINSFNTEGKVKASICAEKEICDFHIVVKENGTARTFNFDFVGNGKQADAEFVIENPLLWSTNTFNLYSFEIEIRYDNEKEIAYGKFGFRTISTNGKNVTLNGTPVFIRGFIRGIKCHDHQNNCKLATEEFYRKNLLQAKRYGFNYVRFHSTVPSEEFFNVADELGFLVHIELRQDGDEYNNLIEMVDTGRDNLDVDFVKNVIDRFYNHPSLIVYCIGNEIKGEEEHAKMRKSAEFIKSTDNSRLFLDTCAWGENNRELVDIDVQHMSYYFPFGKHADMFEDTDNLLVCGTRGGDSVCERNEYSSITRTLFFNVPLIAHEVCHYTALRDFVSLKEKFKKFGTKEPWWIDEELKMIKAKGLTEVYGELYKASRDFQCECWKTAFEAIRSSRLLGGFQMLQFSDTDVYENSNGVVDCFDDTNYVTPDYFNIFNGDEVLLTELGSRQFFAGQEIRIPIKLSNYGERQDKFADFTFSLVSADGVEFTSGNMKNIDVGRRGLYEICKLDLRLPDIQKSDEYTLNVKLLVNGKVYSRNSWKIWVYAKTPFIGYKQFVNYESENSIITDDAETCFNALEQGKSVCFVYRSDWTRHVAHKSMKKPKYALRATWNRFKPVIWDRGTNYGGLCESDLLNKYGFASGRYYDFNYSQITEDCDKIILDDFPVKVKSLISGTDKNVRDRFDAYKDYFNLPELQYDRTLRNFSYLFEVGVEKGKLLVCGLNMTGLDFNEPSTLAMSEFIKSYISSEDFAPINNISVKQLKEYMCKQAEKPVKEGMMTQFWQLDDTPVESKEYWKESEAYLRENDI